MARPLRIEYPGAFYHVLNRGLERREIFRDAKDYTKFLALLDPLFDRYQVRLHSYCLMPNHYHLYVETPQGYLSKIMRHLDGVYTQSYNRRYKRVGPLLQGRYNAILIEKEGYSLEISRYIHLNPVKARFVERPEDWEWSSYRIFMGKQRNEQRWLETGWLLGQFLEKASEARRLFQRFTLQGLGREWNPREATKGFILGSESFARWVKEEFLDEGKKPDVSGIRELERRTASLEERLEKVQGLTQDSRLRRKLEIYVARKYSPLSLREIGQRVGGVGYQGVYLAIRRLEESAKRDSKIQQLLERIKRWNV